MIKFKGLFARIIEPRFRFTMINNIVKLLSNPLVVLLVPIFLDENTQGYWYTFGSLAALTTFADMGFTTIITQFVSHEMTYLKLNKNTGKIEGPEEKFDRLASLTQFVIKWFCIILGIAFFVILIVGFVILSGQKDGVRWTYPWIVYVVGTIFNFATQVVFSYYEGCNEFETTQKIRAISTIAYCGFTAILLACGAGLYALGLPLLLRAITSQFMLRKKFGKFTNQLIHKKIVSKFNWIKEIIPLLGRYAISWVSGYFSTQIYNPLIFRLYGSATAGKVGYCLVIIQAIFSISYIWVTIDIPTYNMLDEQHDWNRKINTFRTDLILTVITYLLGMIALFTTRFFSLLDSILWGRLLGSKAILILGGAYFINIAINIMAVYLRSHKEEPFMWVSVFSGCITAGLTVVSALYFEVELIFIGMFISNILVLPYGVHIFFNRRKVNETL